MELGTKQFVETLFINVPKRRYLHLIKVKITSMYSILGYIWVILGHFCSPARWRSLDSIRGASRPPPPPSPHPRAPQAQAPELSGLPDLNREISVGNAHARENVRIDARKNVKNICQKECQIKCQIECQSICPKECQIECQQISYHAIHTSR